MKISTPTPRIPQSSWLTVFGSKLPPARAGGPGGGPHCPEGPPGGGPCCGGGPCGGGPCGGGPCGGGPCGGGPCGGGGGGGWNVMAFSSSRRGSGRIRTVPCEES